MTAITAHVAPSVTPAVLLSIRRAILPIPTRLLDLLQDDADSPKLLPWDQQCSPHPIRIFKTDPCQKSAAQV